MTMSKLPCGLGSVGIIWQGPFLSSSFGIVFALGGLFVVASLFYFNQIWMAIRFALGFR